LRGDSGWPWIHAGGAAAAAAVAYFRIAADKHWLTDVAVGAAIGSAIGVALPLLLHRGSGGAREAWVQVTPATIGIAGSF
jgi:membrane-associated phospholipid phosphatase